ncbi:ribosomal protein S18-alanine N-acetyltransferase [Ruminiclostridium cellobioparum]|uniref:[Ribosomal protein bS18]-alanine N-acetyltransferase n=1 Tax=Ruminiclostridium cellobioparum subsp. termitidis CT1112 TaxID=1195236 RepID=S0FH30_RUMCE|nr:ribosomal protein S18-alanine N-acetyltransferase [Ruminiclostridium cellobioparum]EMS70632.1 ribosomal-protein-alanine acetyltransferase [Ruminiclostridium cellobioparum subsp. termitidis CT1112]
MVNNIEVVQMTPEHLDGVMIIENLSFKIPWSRNAFMDELSTNQMALYVVAVSGSEVIGYGGLWRILDEGHITNIAVHPEFRRCGAGSRILDKLLEICDINGIRSLTLEVRKSNLPAQKLYEKYGFKAEGLRKGYYSDTGEDALIMWRHTAG